MRSPFVTRRELTLLEEHYAERLFQLNQALAANGELRRQVASLELENAELRRQVAEHSGRWPER